MSTSAVVLCGGQSRRMGQPKAWLPFGPEVLLQRVVRLVAHQSAGPVVVVAADGQELPDLPGSVRIVRDAVANRGPLQGLAAGLSALPESSSLVYVTATDGPFLAPGWISTLQSLIKTADLAVPRHNGRLHPLAALYRREPILPLVNSLLASDQLRLLSLVDSAHARIVSADELRTVDPDLKTLRNLNTLDDYRLALADLNADPTDAIPLNLPETRNL